MLKWGALRIWRGSAFILKKELLELGGESFCFVGENTVVAFKAVNG